MGYSIPSKDRMARGRRPSDILSSDNDNERECSMGYSIPSKDRMARGRRPSDILSSEGRYIP